MPGFQNRGFAYKTKRSGFGGSGGGQRRKAPSKHGQYIDPSRFVRVAKPPTVEEAYVPENMFADFKVDPRLHANIAAKGYVAPTPIQDKTIALGLAGKDVIGIANTGTGKTAAFAVPILHQLMSNKTSRALIVAQLVNLLSKSKKNVAALERAVVLLALSSSVARP